MTNDKLQRPTLSFALIVCATVLGLAGIDLVLPAIPSLPNSLPGNLEQAQLVLATFAIGTAFGLLAFGELGARFDKRRLLVASLAAYAILSLYAALSSSVLELVAIRFFQGFVSAAAAVFAPGLIRSMFDDQSAVRAIGLMGSIESLTPAFAPIIGAWFLTFADWRLSFFVTAALACLLAALWWWLSRQLTSSSVMHSDQPAGGGRGYLGLLNNTAFLRHALSHACTLGGLLIFVFGAPTVITVGMDGSLSDFVTMQLIGISLFIISANSTHKLVSLFGRETVILVGSLMTACGCLAILLYGYFFGTNPKVLWLLFAPVNLGLGLRGPPGFYQAIIESGDNDARGAALMILFILGIAALGTAIAAPFIEKGLVPLSLVASAVTMTSVLLLVCLKGDR